MTASKEERKNSDRIIRPYKQRQKEISEMVEIQNYDESKTRKR